MTQLRVYRDGDFYIEGKRGKTSELPEHILEIFNVMIMMPDGAECTVNGCPARVYGLGNMSARVHIVLGEADEALIEQVDMEPII